MRDIILTGAKHCGKTNAGKALAAAFPCEFIDLDDLIFQRTGKSPRELYTESPEIFQKAETEAIAALSSDGESQRVIATGGGIIDNQEAINIMKNSGAIIALLNISAETAWGRIRKKELPPFLKTENPQETHRVLHERRNAAYLKLADIIVDAEKNTSVEIAGKIREALASL